ncbi:ATP-binding protein [Alteromonas sp.]|nr:ATP-binding protein [Alteromonas sp.]
MAQYKNKAALEQRIEQLERALAEANEQKSRDYYYQILFENMQHEVHIWKLVYNDDGSIKTWYLADANNKALTSWGKSLNDIIGKTADEIFESNVTQQFLPIVEHIFSDNRPYSWEYQFDPTSQCLSMTSFPFDNYFISTGVDITSTKQIEIKLRDTVIKLGEAISAGNIGLWDWDLITNKTFFSPEWKKQLGYASHEIKNEFTEWETRVHPDDIQRTLNHINRTLIQGENYHEIEFRMKHKDGSYRWILAHASIIKDGDDKPIRLVGSHIDITDRKSMEETALQQQKLQALGTLAGGIAHDFNNLLTPILGYTQLLKTLTQSSIKEYEYLTHIEDSATRARQLTQQILMMSRKSVQNIEPVYLDKLAAEVCSVIKGGNCDNIIIKSDIEEELPAIGADPDQLYRVMLNLCTNAVHAMPNGGTLSLDIKACSKKIAALDDDTPNDYIYIKISDTGKGIESKNLDRIFEPFFTTKLHTSQRGTGLGLAIVNSLVEQHRGHIEVKSVVGKGTEFILYLPVISEDILAREYHVETMGTFKNCHVVLIDDELAICQLGEALLSQMGCNIVTFQNTEACINYLKIHEEEVNVVITDYAMPEMNGDAFIAALRATDISLPCVVSTGFTDLVSSDNCARWDCAAIISKPFNIQELSTAIATAQKKNDVKKSHTSCR